MKLRLFVLSAVAAALIMFAMLNQPWQSELVRTAAITKTIEVTGLQILPGSNAILLVSVVLCLLLLISRGGFRIFLALFIAISLCAISLQCFQAGIVTTIFSQLTQKFEALSGLAAADPHTNLQTHHVRAWVAASAALISALLVIARVTMTLWFSQDQRKFKGNPVMPAKKAKTNRVQTDPWAETSNRK